MRRIPDVRLRDGRPVALRWNQHYYRVTRVLDAWRETGEWWAGDAGLWWWQATPLFPDRRDAGRDVWPHSLASVVRSISTITPRTSVNRCQTPDRTCNVARISVTTCLIG